MNLQTILERITLDERVEQSAAGKALVIQQIDRAMDAHSVETVLTWVCNLAHVRGYTVTVTGQEPGTIGDPRR